MSEEDFDDELSSDRFNAQVAFRTNIGFFQAILESTDENVSDLIENATDNAKNALVYLCFFIFKREIPISKEATEFLERHHLETILKTFSKHSFEEILQDAGKKTVLITKLESAFRHLLKPLF